MIKVAKAPILNIGEVLKIPFGKLMAFESSCTFILFNANDYNNGHGQKGG